MLKNYYMNGQQIKGEINMEQPNAKKHQIISFIKSIIRIVGYVIIPIDLTAAAIVLVVSEGVGILEELV